MTRLLLRFKTLAKVQNTKTTHSHKMDTSDDLIIVEPVTPQTQTLRSNRNKVKNVGGWPLGEIWLHFERKEAISPGKFGVE